MDLSPYIRDVPDFPRPGIIFKDISPLLANPTAFGEVVAAMAEGLDGSVDLVCGIESRGFLFAVPIAQALGVGFIPARKAGKLPGDIEAVAYSLEYGEEHLELRTDAVAPRQRVLVVDDVLATGGTAGAAETLIERLGGVVAGHRFLIELGFLDGRAKLHGDVGSLLTVP